MRASFSRESIAAVVTLFGFRLRSHSRNTVSTTASCLGTTLAAVNWYEDAARRKGLPQSRLTLILVATSAAAMTVVLQQAAHVLGR